MLERDNVGRLFLGTLALAGAVNLAEINGALKPEIASAAPQEPNKTLNTPENQTNPKDQIKPVPPIFYQHYAPPTEIQDRALPEMGYLAYFPWKEIHKGDGVFDFSSIENYINRVGQNQMITVNGELIHPPIIVGIQLYASATNSVYGVYDDLSPDFVKHTSGSHELNPDPSRCTTKVAPKYEDPYWQEQLADFFQKLGEVYNNRTWQDNGQKQISGIVFGIGIDEETGMDTKNIPSSCNYRATLASQIPGGYDGYLSIISNGQVPPQGLLQEVVESFPDTPILVRVTSGAKDRVDSMLSGYDNHAVILDQAALSDDSNNREQSNNMGVDDLARRYIHAWETAFHTQFLGTTDVEKEQNIIQTLYAAFSDDGQNQAGEPNYVSHIELLNTWLTFIKQHPEVSPYIKELQPYLGKDLAYSPKVFTVFRETQYTDRKYGSVTYSGHEGNFDHGITLLNIDQTQLLGSRQNPDALTQPNPPLPFPASEHPLGYRARWAYQFDLKIDNQWTIAQRTKGNPSFDLEIRAVNANEVIVVRYKNWASGAIIEQEVQMGEASGPLDQFVSLKVRLMNPDFNHSGENGEDISIVAESGKKLTVQSLWLGPVEGINTIHLPVIQSNN